MAGASHQKAAKGLNEIGSIRTGSTKSGSGDSDNDDADENEQLI